MNYLPSTTEFQLDNGKLAVLLEAQQAIRTLIRWAGDDPNREGLLDTPAGRGKNIAKATTAIRAFILRTHSRKWTVTTKSCC